MGAVLDTNVIIEIARGNREVFEKVITLDNTFYITAMTKFEILVGTPRKDGLIWLETLIELPFDGKCAEMASYLHKKLMKMEHQCPTGIYSSRLSRSSTACQ